MLNLPRVIVLTMIWVLFPLSVKSAEFSAKTGAQFRFDDRSSKPERYQYRIRFYPQITFDDQKNWSLNGFAATGDDFSSSHNTIDDSDADFFYVRRLYLRHQQGEGKTEIGVIPTYKGRVSSTGLSKDGWLTGLRQVVGLPGGKVELTVGDLADTQARNALDGFNSLNYIELEYSSDFAKNYSYELSVERLLESNFVTAEVRYRSAADVIYGAEIINRLDNQESKVIISAEGQFEWLSREVDYFAYYSYSDNDFGPRDELTEDFLASGHGLSIEFESTFDVGFPLDWFARFEAVQSNTRAMVGVKYSFTL